MTSVSYNNYDVNLRERRCPLDRFAVSAGCSDATPRRQRRHVGEVMEYYKTDDFFVCQERCGKHYACLGAHLELNKSRCHMFR